MAIISGVMKPEREREKTTLGDKFKKAEHKQTERGILWRIKSLDLGFCINELDFCSIVMVCVFVIKKTLTSLKTTHTWKNKVRAQEDESYWEEEYEEMSLRATWIPLLCKNTISGTYSLSRWWRSVTHNENTKTRANETVRESGGGEGAKRTPD